MLPAWRPSVIVVSARTGRLRWHVAFCTLSLPSPMRLSSPRRRSHPLRKLNIDAVSTIHDAFTGRDRSGGIDLVRCLGVIAVVAGHVWETPQSRAWLYPWHVPVFFFLTGYLWKPGRSIGHEFRSRWATLGVPYLVWLAILWVTLMFVLLQEGRLTLRDAALPLYGGAVGYRPFTTFWFVSALFFAALLYRCAERFAPRLIYALLLGALLLGAIPAVARMLAYTPLSMGSALTCFAFIAAGACCRAVRGPAPRRTDLPLGILLVAAGIAGFVFGWLAPLNLKSGNFGTPLLSAIAACAISFGMVLVCEWIALRVSLLDRLAQHVAPWPCSSSSRIRRFFGRPAACHHCRCASRWPCVSLH